MKKIGNLLLCIILLATMIISLNFNVQAVNDEIPEPEYELIEGDIRNSKEIKNNNINFNDVIYYMNDMGTSLGEESYWLVLDTNSRVKIDYSHEIFKGHEFYDEEEEEFYEGTVDSSRTKINTDSGMAELEFYGYYNNSKGKKVDVEDFLFKMQLRTKNVNKNEILFVKKLDTENKQQEELSNNIIRFDVGMTVSDAKKELKDMLIKYSTEMTYMNNNGEVKTANISIEYTSIEFYKQNKEKNDDIALKDDEKIMTGLGVLLNESYVKSSFPSDFEFDENMNMYADGHGLADLQIACVGDITGTGIIEEEDLTKMQEEIVGIEELEDAYFEAADINDDDTLDVLDLSEIQQYIDKSDNSD